MRITSVELAGSIETGQRLPRAYARLSRAADSEEIKVEILARGGDQVARLVHIDYDQGLQDASRLLQKYLEGQEGEGPLLDSFREVLDLFCQ